MRRACVYCVPKKVVLTLITEVLRGRLGVSLSPNALLNPALTESRILSVVVQNKQGNKERKLLSDV